MTYQQQQAIKIIESDVLFEAQSDRLAEYVNLLYCKANEQERYMLATEKVRRTTGGVAEGIEKGEYNVLITPNEEGTLHVELCADYGIFSTQSYYAEILTDGTIITE